MRIERLSPQSAPASAEEIVTIYRDVWIATYPSSKVNITKEDLEDNFANFEGVISYWQHNILNSSDRAVWLVWNAESKPVAFCIAKKDDTENELEYIYLLPECQGKGLGEQLMRLALDWLNEHKPIVLYGAAYNEKAIHSYERFGFKLSKETVSPKPLRNGKLLPSMKMILSR